MIIMVGLNRQGMVYTGLSRKLFFTQRFSGELALVGGTRFVFIFTSMQVLTESELL